jgi:hypothetical protein
MSADTLQDLYRFHYLQKLILLGNYPKLILPTIYSYLPIYPKGRVVPLYIFLKVIFFTFSVFEPH